VSKPRCHWCGAERSRVVRSKGQGRTDGYRRRRECLECGRRFPTLELVDVERFRRELRTQGLNPADFGL
jgi:transcriptional regulator NrdR family protein